MIWKIKWSNMQKHHDKADNWCQYINHLYCKTTLNMKIYNSGTLNKSVIWKKKIITKCLWFPFFTLLNGLYPFNSISFAILHVCKNVQLNIRELSKIIKKVFAVSFCYLHVRCPFITEYRSVYHFCILHRRGFNVETNAFYISNRIHYVSY